MIQLKEVLQLHDLLITHFGGSAGVRDIDLLNSALARPFQTFDGVDLHPSIKEKAAAVVESILINHPFIDGNKRTGYSVLKLYLQVQGYEIIASSDDRYDIIVGIASGSIAFDKILTWMDGNTKQSIGV